MHSFVAIDLELTPLSADQRIIEVAAVRFVESAPAESFSTLVNPGCDLSRRIESLTGIHQDELNCAPNFGQVAPALVSFVGNDPLVGQSIDLDIEQLVAQGVRFQNRAYDSYELATLLLPGLPAYDLSTLARTLGVEIEQEHRALGDAIVAGKVFLALLDRAAGLGLEVVSQVSLLASRIPGWQYAGIFEEIRPRLARGEQAEERIVGDRRRAFGQGSQQLSLAPTHQPSRDPSDRTIPLDRDELRALLAPGGAVAAAVPAFEEREEQLRMVDAVVDALNEDQRLLIEAGTGTGKSLAYLLPAIYFAVRNGKRVLISTNTLNLQDQLYGKDIPALQACLPLRFRAALVKGRSNYLCYRRWLALSRSPALTPAETALLIKTLIWLSTTETGDKAELNLSSDDASLWSRISGQGESCALGKCPQFRGGSCFVNRARRNAQTADIVVVNHALLLSDLAAPGGVLPDYSHLIIDEAHHLEEQATEQLGFELSCASLLSFLESIHDAGGDRKPSGFLADLRAALAYGTRERSPAGAGSHTVEAWITAAQSCVDAAHENGHLFFESLNCFLRHHMEDRPRGARLRVASSVRVQPGWSEVEVRWSELSARLSALERALSRVQLEVEALNEGQMIERDGLIADLVGFQSRLETIQGCGSEIVSTPDHNGIYWAECGPSLEDLAIHSAPLHVGEALNEVLFRRKESVILTSATLATEGSFDYIRERLGLEDAQELILASPFDYKRSTLLYVVQDIPEPTKPSCQRAVENAIADVVIAAAGRTLVLFTSHAQLKLAAGAVRPRLEEQEIVVLAHGVDGSRRRLLQAFKSSEKAVLMGTSSFWEGIDVVGEALSCVIIVKLPFSVPTDPVFSARSEAFDEPFRQFSVPQTILRLKQGFGRLIRSRSDRGAVVILDSRLGSKFYGPSFIHSLPRCSHQMGSSSDVAEAVKKWLGIKEGRPAHGLPSLIGT